MAGAAFIMRLARMVAASDAIALESQIQRRNRPSRKRSGELQPGIRRSCSRQG